MTDLSITQPELTRGPDTPPQSFGVGRALSNASPCLKTQRTSKDEGSRERDGKASGREVSAMSDEPGTERRPDSPMCAWSRSSELSSWMACEFVGSHSAHAHTSATVQSAKRKQLAQWTRPWEPPGNVPPRDARVHSAPKEAAQTGNRTKQDRRLLLAG